MHQQRTLVPLWWWRLDYIPIRLIVYPSVNIVRVITRKRERLTQTALWLKHCLHQKKQNQLVGRLKNPQKSYKGYLIDLYKDHIKGHYISLLLE